jgi:hypothetical protein
VPASPKDCIAMLTATKSTKIDPIFAAIEAHRQATGERYIILKALGGMTDDAPERGVTEDADGKAADVEVAARCCSQSAIILSLSIPTSIPCNHHALSGETPSRPFPGPGRPVSAATDRPTKRAAA